MWIGSSRQIVLDVFHCVNIMMNMQLCGVHELTSIAQRSSVLTRPVLILHQLGSSLQQLDIHGVYDLLASLRNAAYVMSSGKLR